MSSFTQFAVQYRVAAFDSLTQKLSVLLPTVNLRDEALKNLSIFNNPYTYLFSQMWKTKELFEKIDMVACSGYMNSCDTNKLTNPTSDPQSFNSNLKLAPTFMYGEGNALKLLLSCDATEMQNTVDDDIMLTNTWSTAHLNDITTKSERFVTHRTFDVQNIADVNLYGQWKDLFILASDQTQPFITLLTNILRIKFYTRNAIDEFNQKFPVQVKNDLTAAFTAVQNSAHSIANMTAQQQSDVTRLLADTKEAIDRLESVNIMSDYGLDPVVDPSSDAVRLTL